jgi:hypothetical protein
MLQRTYEKHPSSPEAPWRIIVNQDEFVPGAVLRQDNKRKTLHFYLSILELGRNYLHLDGAWLPFGGLRATVCKKVRGGVSAVNRLIVRQVSSSSLDDGILLPIGEDQSEVYVFFTHGRQVADIPAGAQVWNTRGHNATFPCTICANVTAFGDRGLRDDAAGWLVDVSCSDPRRFQIKTSDEIFDQCDVLAELARRGLPDEVVNDYGQRNGLTHNPDGLLWDLQLRPVVGVLETWTYDGAHTLYGDGILQGELSETLAVINADTRTTFTELRSLFDASWKTCSAFGSRDFGTSLHGILSAKREMYFKENGKFPGQMTEIISLLPVVEFYVEHTDMERRHPLELDRFRAGCRVNTQYWKCKWSNDIERDADRFAELVADYLTKRHAAASEDTEWKFKHHAAQHLARQMPRDGCVIDCLPGERAHLLARAVSGMVGNTKCFERTMLPRMLIGHFNKAEEAESFDDRLIGRTFDVPELGRAKGAQKCILWGARLGECDVVFLDASHDPVLVKTCIDIQGCGLALLVTPLLYVRDINRAATLHRDSGRTEIVRRGDCTRVLLCRAWSIEADGGYVVVRAGSVY